MGFANAFVCFPHPQKRVILISPHQINIPFFWSSNAIQRKWANRTTAEDVILFLNQTPPPIISKLSVEQFIVTPDISIIISSLFNGSSLRELALTSNSTFSEEWEKREGDERRVRGWIVIVDLYDECEQVFRYHQQLLSNLTHY